MYDNVGDINDDAEVRTANLPINLLCIWIYKIDALYCITWIIILQLVAYGYEGPKLNDSTNNWNARLFFFFFFFG